MNDDTTTKIRLTSRPPVQIIDADWPVIATRKYLEYDGEFEFQANRTWKARVAVRRHADGRTIVHGSAVYSTAFQGERDNDRHAGYLLDAGEDPIQAIHTVCAALAEMDGIPDLSDDVIGSLPAETI